MFDFSSYPKDPKFFDDTNKRVIRKTKDESEWKIIDEFVGLKSKMFSIGGKESNTAKGVNIATEFSEFKDTLLNKKVLRHKMGRIQGKKHKMGTYEINKILSVFDDKRFVLSNGIHTFTYFHKDSKNRFTQMIINKERFKKILIKRKDSHKWLQIKRSACK